MALRRPLCVNFPRGTQSEASQNRKWRAPSLQCVLQQECSDHRWNCQPSAIDSRAKHSPSKGKRRGIRLQRPLDIPFLVKFPKAAADRLRTGSMPSHAGLGIGLYLPVHSVASVLRNAF
jgi:hypothetical protein